MQRILIFFLFVSLFSWIQIACEKQSSNEHEEHEKLSLRTLVISDSTFFANAINEKRKGDYPSNKYIVDTTHSSVQFNVKHWGIYDLIGRLESYTIDVFYDSADFSDMFVEAKLRPSSINMPNAEMANHLKMKGFGFFDVEDYPTVSFISKDLTEIGDSTYVLNGLMTIKEKTAKVSFEIFFNGYTHPPTKSNPGFTAKGKIRRSDFDLGGMEMLPGNGLPIIEDEVFITINARLITDYD